MSDKAEASGSGGRDLQPQEAAEANRRPPEAASVNRRWWEDGAAVESPLRPHRNQAEASAGKLLRLAPPPPPPAAWSSSTVVTAASVPPLSPPGWSAQSGAAVPMRTELLVFADVPRIQHLEQELEAMRQEAAALQELLEDLPEIYERKFRQRLQGTLEQQQLLLEDNHRLREQLAALLPLVAESGARRHSPLPAAPPSSDPGAEADAQPRRSLLHSLGRIGSGRGAGNSSSSPGTAAGQLGQELSAPSDDGPPRAA